MWNYISLSQSAQSHRQSADAQSHRQSHRQSAYTTIDAVVYVLTLCAAATAVSAAKAIPVQRWLGTQWVLGWFALDAVWNPTSSQQQFRTATQYLVFLLGLVAHIALLYYVDRTTLDYANIAVVGASVVFWCLVEDTCDASLRTSVKITALYASAFFIAFVSSLLFDFHIQPPSWVYYFVAIQYSGVKHHYATLLSKFLHAWIWAVLVYDLATDQLDFSIWF